MWPEYNVITDLHTIVVQFCYRLWSVIQNWIVILLVEILDNTDTFVWYNVAWHINQAHQANRVF